ncbi:unnamed protein product [Oppiella nova]|uniref:Uncharacterized protein n=1 Tax=Oppiella nova TaxID=334625 RepID=A0A7R9MRU8_9ACAR|nr:unnamed protein product [Oppiella nova]CAG2181861.1 unnamed protein product [Oppiella nova]
MSADTKKEASGPTRGRLRDLQKRRYTEDGEDEEDLFFAGRGFDVDQKLVSDRFDPQKYDVLQEMTGDQLTIRYIQDKGFSKPIIVKQMKGWEAISCLTLCVHYMY